MYSFAGLISHTVKKSVDFTVKIPGIWLPVLLPLVLRASYLNTCRTFYRYGRVMLTDNTRKYLCRIEGLYDKKKKKIIIIMSFATVRCLIPEMFTGACKKNNGKWAGADCQLFYRKTYGIFYSADATADVQ